MIETIDRDTTNAIRELMGLAARPADDGFRPAPRRTTPLSDRDRAYWRRLLVPLFNRVVLGGVLLRRSAAAARR